MSYFGASVLSLLLGVSFLVGPVPTPHDAPESTVEIIFEEPVSSTKSHDTYSFPRYSTQISMPNIYSVQKNEFEPLRRGAETSYNLTYLTSNTKDYYISEIQFFTKASVQKFNETCDVATDFCFEGYAPTPTDFENLKKALTDSTEFTSNYYDGLDAKRLTINKNPTIRISEKCTGDICMVMEYYYLQGDTIVSLNVIAYNPQDDFDTIIQNSNAIAEEVIIETAQ